MSGGNRLWLRFGWPRRGGRATAAVGVLTVAGVLGAILPNASAGAVDVRPFGAVRMNQIQFMGAHNAYHQELQGTELAIATRLDPTYPSWGAYSHAPVPDLLGQEKVRGLEFDVLPDPQGGLYQKPLLRQKAGLGPIDDPVMSQPGMKVLHVPDLDYHTSCLTLVACLRQVKTWRDANPNEIPIIIQLELKDTEDQVEQAGGVVSPEWDATLLDDLDREIRSVFPPKELITADDLRKPGHTLEQSVLRYGWPTLGWARGKVLFFFDNGADDPIRSLYTKGRPNLEGRAVFTQGNPGDPDAAITKVNDPRGENEAIIRDLVRRGYFVRTRADEPLSTVMAGETSRVETALASGAQLVSTDFPVPGMSTRYGTDFVAQLPGGAVVRCNPVAAPHAGACCH